MNWLWKKRKESGQAMVEFALVFPVFLLLLCGIIDFGWLGYQQLLFESAYHVTAWNFPLKLLDGSGNELKSEDIIEGAVPSTYNHSSPEQVVVLGVSSYALGDGIKEHMLACAPDLLNRSELEVKNAKATFSSAPVLETYPIEGSENANFETRHVKVLLNADINYAVKLLTPLGETLFGGEKILHKKLVRERTEQIGIKRRVTIPASSP